MKLIHHASEFLPALLECLNRHQLFYGPATCYQSLLTPLSVSLSAYEATDIEDDMATVWRFYRIWNQLYVAAMANEAPSWIKIFVEQGLAPDQIQVHRMMAQAGIEPRLCRIDYVTLGDQRQIAEVQWKSGGLGLFFGIHDVCNKIIPSEPQSRPLGDLVANLQQLILQSVGNINTDGVTAIQATDTGWFRGEHYLKQYYAQCGLHYIPIHGRMAASMISERRGAYWLSRQGRLQRISYAYGYPFINCFRGAALTRLAEAMLDGTLLLETSLNFLYRQKWGMALPFHPIWSHHFDEAIRKVLIPTMLIRADSTRNDMIDFSPLLPYLEHPQRERLLSLQELTDIASLPASLRKELVFKCGAGMGDYHSRGQGVFRIGGSAGSARKVLTFINDRVNSLGESWIVQKYVRHRQSIEVSLPWQATDMTLIKAHARYMIYGGRLDIQKPPNVLGGLGNFDSHWKVSGRSPVQLPNNRLMGSAFASIRCDI